MTVTLFFIIAICSQIIPRLDLISNLNGGFAGLILAVVMPILIYHQAYPELPWYNKTANWIILLISVALGLTTIVITTLSILNE